MVSAAVPSAANASSAGPLVYVKKSSTAGTGELSREALCPAGSRLAGGGGGISAPGGFNARLTTIAPIDLIDPDSDADDGFATEAYSIGDARRASATAICLKAGRSALTYELETTQLAMNESNADEVFCQSGHTVGGGTDMNASNGDTRLSQSGPADSPIPDGRPDDGWQWSGQNNGASTKNVINHAVCLAAGVHKTRYVSKTRAVSASKEKALTAHCPPGFHVSGGGWEGFFHPHSSQPFDGPDADKAPDDGWRVQVLNFGSPNTLTVHAICLQ